jgi:ribosomal protein S12 methylthiotransferase accessory factor
MEMSFPGGLAVDAHFRGGAIHTDQPEKIGGGGGTAPAPFDLFLASIGTCAGFYTLSFCQQRDIDVRGLEVSLQPVREAADKRLATIRIRVRPPSGFPEKYHRALLRAVDQCAVKRCIMDPPQFEVFIDPAPE